MKYKSKYKIKETEDKYGFVWFTAYYRFLFFWIPLEYMWATDKWTKSYKESTAIKLIEEHKEKHHKSKLKKAKIRYYD